MAQKKRPSGGRRTAAKPASRGAARPQAVVRATEPLPALATANTAVIAASTTGPLPLGSSLSIREVAERAAQLKALFATGSAVVDARQLESVDTAGLQLLLAAAAAARRRGLTLKLLGAGGLKTGPADALGLAEQLAATAEILP
jgi:ABC-type transporter Mla MlaB component